MEENQSESNEEIQQRMEQLMQNSYLDVETALGKLQLKSSDARNVYVIGSRLWGTATEKSDWDLIIVTSSPSITGKNSMHNSDIDATVYSLLEFEQKLKEHSFLEVICLFLPKQYVWREEVDFRKGFIIQPKSLLASVEEETGSSEFYLTKPDRDWKMTQKYFEKGNIDRGKKTIVHALRLLLISMQLIESGSVTNLYAGIQYSNELSLIYGKKDWKFFDSKYSPVFKECRLKLRKVALAK